MTTTAIESRRDTEPVYGVPGSGAPLCREDGALRCRHTRLAFAIQQEIPQFLERAGVESAAECEKLNQLNHLAADVGWQQALAKVYGASTDIYRYVTDMRRGVFLELLPLERDSAVLEVGPGLGQLTGLLAERAGHVHALEVVAGQAEFVRQRMEQTGQRNVDVACGGDACRLPYRAESFDVVVMNLVFEWCGSRNAAERPVEGQRRMLGEVWRVLRPGGTMYLATKNRYGLGYLLAGRDEHAFGMRFGSALPRWWLACLLRLKGRPRPPGLLHSHRGLRRLLRDAGMEDPRSYWAVPEMRYPKEMIPSDAASVRSVRQRGEIQGEGRKLRWLMPLVPAALVKHVTPGLAFTARKPGTGGPCPRQEGARG